MQYDYYHVFKYDGFILNMVIMSNMDTQHNICVFLPQKNIFSHNLLLFKNVCFNYLKQNWKS